ncbi:DUF2298 family protein [Natronomonas pharaonis DSM 2160]|uniref:DUF2298 family protein n=1 Tax=Natronomonas pharaonis (strain ATCC 35678 / DSM 2160 / CIP 103997 / JCM 8858 / NBRC 14720 / NCIMB 2260 / Gabara) TaxID=348780 RepID=A0A1U7EUZ9_NATPD|nr:DUF2298 domain-containing protein [Natronomonas pharaonis]CAI48810.1 DUF2298 family protein [Natronomonas pharaonis DSM 2160]
MEYGLVVAWLAVYLAVGVAALPLAATLFPRFHDAGAAFAIPLGLAVLLFVGYFVGHLAFGWPAVLVALAVLVAASVTLGDTEAIDDRGFLEAAAVFTAAFLFLVAVRSVSPAIAPLPLSSGEKFLDYGLLRTLLRSGALPPEDMWFAGEPVQYYFGGQLLAALLTTITGTAPRFAYNLALAGAYASLVTAAYGLAGAVAAASDLPRRAAALTAAFFVGLAGNLYTAVHAAAWLVPESLAGALPGVAADAEAFGWTPEEFFYWDGTRVIEGTINEFPLFAWLNGDLHAHMLSTPFTLLAAALCYSYWRTPETELPRRRLLLLAVAPVAGLLAITNTWDFPVAAGLVFLTVAFAPSDPATLLPTTVAERIAPRTGIAEELRRDGVGLGVALAVLVVGALSVPFFWLGTASTRSVGLLPPQSDMWPLLVVHGGFLLLFVPFLVGRLSSAFDLRRPPAAAIAAGALAAGIGLWLAFGFAAAALFGPLLVAAWVLLRYRAGVGFETLLLLGGLGLVALVELAYVVEPRYQGTELERMNTVFKAYFQAWVIWAPAAGVVAASLLDNASGWRPDAAAQARLTQWGHRARQMRRVGGPAIVVLAVVAMGLYPALAVPAHFDSEPTGATGPTLDGQAYTHELYPDEAAAIEWLDDRDGQPTLVTAAPGGYTWDPEAGEGASAPASLTGIPTVLGWHHQEQYRGTEPYEARLDAVTALYEGAPDEQTVLFERYGVDYVYVGPTERTRYDLTIEDHPDLDVAFEQGSVVVYAVDG